MEESFESNYPVICQNSPLEGSVQHPYGTTSSAVPRTPISRVMSGASGSIK
jgi:hypothetical protein